MGKYFGTGLHIFQATATTTLLVILWWHFHVTSDAKIHRIQGTTGSATIYLIPEEQRDGTLKMVPVCEFNDTTSPVVWRLHHRPDGYKGTRYRRQHNATLDFSKEMTVKGLRVIEDKKK